jgi:hypothetical protein
MLLDELAEATLDGSRPHEVCACPRHAGVGHGVLLGIARSCVRIPKKLMFQKDYWSTSDKELDRIATKYHIPPMSLPLGDSN